MRKPAVVVAFVLALSLFITLARRLAQPAISDQAVVATESTVQPVASEAPVMAPAPIRPTVTEVAQAVDDKPRVQKATRAKRTGRSSAQASANAVDSLKQEKIRYEALLASPGHAFSRVRDYGAHGLGSPKWIESLSGAKARVPVRDFSGESAQKSQGIIEPLAVPVDSRVELAH